MYIHDGELEAMGEKSEEVTDRVFRVHYKRRNFRKCNIYRLYQNNIPPLQTIQ